MIRASEPEPNSIKMFILCYVSSRRVVLEWREEVHKCVQYIFRNIRISRTCLLCSFFQGMKDSIEPWRAAELDGRAFIANGIQLRPAEMDIKWNGSSMLLMTWLSVMNKKPIDEVPHVMICHSHRVLNLFFCHGNEGRISRKTVNGSWHLYNMTKGQPWRSMTASVEN